MEALLDAAEELLRAAGGNGQPPRPDFPIPSEYATLPTDEYIEIRDTPDHKGKGYFAKQDLPRGTLLMVAKPIAMVMDWQGEDDDEEEDDNDDDDDENAMEEDDDKEPRHNELLLLQLLERLQAQPSLWNDCLSHLFPRNVDDLATLPAWVCEDDDVFVQIETALQALKQDPQLSDEAYTDISRRLALIVRYNVLSIETCPDLLSYPGQDPGFSSLAGVGLYHLPSFFNHSRRPNVSRHAVGDVMMFVLNQDVNEGDEVTISYIEHDILCESAARRNHMLSMNFNDADVEEQKAEMEQQHAKAQSLVSSGPQTNGEPEEDANGSGELLDNAAAAAGPNLPVVDSDVQNELMSMDPFDRLEAIKELMAQATGSKQPGSDSVVAEPNAMDHDSSDDGDEVVVVDEASAWFQCDLQNLRILKAITLDGLGQMSQALEQWEAAIEFCETKLPPNDESSIVVRVQAALCAWQAHYGGAAATNGGGGGDATIISTATTTTLPIPTTTTSVVLGGLPSQQMQKCRARQHADAALATHKLLFGGGVQRFKRRMGPDLRLALRPPMAPGGPYSSPVDAMWPPDEQ